MAINESSVQGLLDELQFLTLIRDNEQEVAKGLIKHAIKGIVKLPSAYIHDEDDKLDIYILETVQTLFKNRKQALTGNDETLSVLSDDDLDDIINEQETDKDKIVPNSSLRAFDKYSPRGSYN